MPKIALITDTNSSIPDHIAEKYGIIRVPINIQFGEESYVTGEDIDDEKLFAMIDARKTLPTTAAPSPEAFKRAYEQAFAEGALQVICITCSSKVSATYNAAVMAAELLPDRDITLFDSLQLSLAEGFQVLAAAEAVDSGADRDAVLAKVKAVQANTFVFAALPTLKYLAMGGRMGKMAAGFADTLEIKPILTSDEGKLDLLEKVRTWGKARARLVQLAQESTTDAAIARIGLFHVNNEKGARSLFDLLKAALPLEGVDPLVVEFTPGLSVHAGSGVIGFALVVEG
ncbi:MAG: DegV family protein [Brevefilum sp.]|nr:DegV family protein [Brevefilum sp.]